jgi:hypothetical protein
LKYGLMTLVGASLLSVVFLVHPTAPVIPLSLIPSAFALQSATFENLAQSLGKKGVKAGAPASLMGKSGVKHEFAFALLPEEGKARIVVDTELSVNEVDEMKVLKFYVKVFDVGPEKAVLCVSPKLNGRAATLAHEYGIEVFEDDVPKKLVGLAEKAVEDVLATGSK